jgi:hypothetical protein
MMRTGQYMPRFIFVEARQCKKREDSIKKGTSGCRWLQIYATPGLDVWWDISWAMLEKSIQTQIHLRAVFLKCHFRFQKHQYRNHDWSYIQHSGIYECKRNWSLNKLRITRPRESAHSLSALLFPVHTHTHTRKSEGRHCVSSALIVQFMTATSRMGTLYWQSRSPVQNILTYNGYVNTFHQHDLVCRCLL